MGPKKREGLQYIKIWLFLGTVYWGAMLPPSMLGAKGAAFSTARLTKTCSKDADGQTLYL